MQKFQDYRLNGVGTTEKTNMYTYTHTYKHPANLGNT